MTLYSETEERWFIGGFGQQRAIAGCVTHLPNYGRQPNAYTPHGSVAKTALTTRNGVLPTIKLRRKCRIHD